MSIINTCHGCLSVDRQLFAVEEHAKLYRQLLLKKSNTNIKKMMICWECNKILNNVHTFRMRITQAQKLISEKSLSLRYSLSNLTVTKKVDDYKIIIYEDEKPNLPPELLSEDPKTIKEENLDFQSDLEVEINDNIKIKEEFNNESEEIENDDFYDDDDKGDIPQLEEVSAQTDLPEKKIKVEEGEKIGGKLQENYTIVVWDDIPDKDKRKYYDVIPVDMNVIKQDMEKRRKKSSTKKFQCQRCYSSFVRKTMYRRHVAAKHAEYNKYECDICGIRFPELGPLARHVREHYRRLRCARCGALFRDRAALYKHFRRGPHRRVIECNKCDASFDSRNPRKFRAHYRAAHHGLVVCDHCGMRCSKKSRLAHHIRIRHSEIRCNICDIGFRQYGGLKQHNQRKHVVEATERNYCVECDLQFSNDYLYHEHVTRSVKHKVKPRVPCPECDRTYSKRSHMMNHYNLEHLKASKHVCPICNRGFLNSNRLGSHVKYTHQKLPKPKKHFCSYCDKGFSERRILENHVRTHTGERPFACAHCPAAFTQSQALKTHERSVHK